MIEIWQIIGILILVMVVLWSLFRHEIKKNKLLNAELENLKYAKQSQSVKYGYSIEEFIPFMKNYPYDPNNARHLGKPIDYIQFEPNKIIFIEVKGGKSKRNENEDNVKRLVEEKRIEWKEIRI